MKKRSRLPASKKQFVKWTTGRAGNSLVKKTGCAQQSIRGYKRTSPIPEEFGRSAAVRAQHSSGAPREDVTKIFARKDVTKEITTNQEVESAGMLVVMLKTPRTPAATGKQARRIGKREPSR